MRAMRSSGVRKTRAFSLDPDVLSEVERTKGHVSASERVNRLLKFALEMEQKAALSREAAEFFGSAPDDREESRAFRKAGLKVLSRE
jgi:hypothetical protein